MTLDHPTFGQIEKYLVANKAWYDSLPDQIRANPHIPNALKPAIVALVEREVSKIASQGKSLRVFASGFLSVCNFFDELEFSSQES